MEEQMTKAKLLDTMRRERAQWESLLAEVDKARMTQPGAAGHCIAEDGA